MTTAIKTPLAKSIETLLRVSDSGKLATVCDRLRADGNFLAAQDTGDSGVWRDAYLASFGVAPSRKLLEDNADAAIKAARGILKHRKGIGATGQVALVASALNGLLEYRISIAPYFTEPPAPVAASAGSALPYQS